MPHVETHTAVYTGSFDPITLGHLNVIERGSRIFDRLIVGIGINVEKTPLFSPEEREHLITRVISDSGLENVQVASFTGLAVNFVRQMKARIMLRGVRPLTDIEAELTMMLANRQLDADIETVFLMADTAYSHVSSSLIKQIAPLANDGALEKFLPRLVIDAMRSKMAAPAGT